MPVMPSYTLRACLLMYFLSSFCILQEQKTVKLSFFSESMARNYVTIACVVILLTSQLLQTGVTAVVRGMNERHLVATRSYYSNLCDHPSRTTLCEATGSKIGERSSSDVIKRVEQLCKVCGFVYGDTFNYCCLCNEKIFGYCMNELNYFGTLDIEKQ